MSIRPVHTWWLGVALFTPSVLMWFVMTSRSIYSGMVHFQFEWDFITRVYLPMLAAIVGFSVPIVCLRLLRGSSWRVTACAFVAYLAVMFTWGIIDIRCEHYQVGSHDYPIDPMVDGHTYYRHVYYTWYFIPYKKRGIAA